jgi:hypothetical protein
MAVRCLQSLACNKSQSYITPDSQLASPSWCQASIWDPRPICQKFFLDSCGFVDVGPLLREDGSVVCSAMTQVQFQVILRPTVCRPFRLGAGPLSGAHDQTLISLIHSYFPICSTQSESESELLYN